MSRTLKGQNRRQVTITSAYQPVTDSITSGLMTVAAQQRSLLIKSRDTVTEPRKPFKRDLRILLQQLTDRGDKVLLVGDFNESTDEQFNGLSKIISDFHLVDLMRRQSIRPLPATLQVLRSLHDQIVVNRNHRRSCGGDGGVSRGRGRRPVGVTTLPNKR